MLEGSSAAVSSPLPKYRVDPLLDKLQTVVARKSSGMDGEQFAMKGLWRVDYRYRPNVLERDLSYSMVYAQANRIGCAYVDYASYDLDERWLGEDTRRLPVSAPASLRIAALDAAFAELPRTPAATFTFDGTAEEKAIERARIICRSVAEEAERRGAKRLLNIGVMGNFVPWLRDAGFTYVGSDYDSGLIDNGINGCPVLDGRGTLDAIADADVVLATGMTLTTGTLSAIIESCMQSETMLVLFAATGSYFAETYCREMGVDVVLAELQPQYMFTGQSVIELHRSSR